MRGTKRISGDGQEGDVDLHENQGEGSRRTVLKYGVTGTQTWGPSREPAALSLAASSRASGEKPASIRHLGEQRGSSCDPETTNVFLKQPQGTASLVSALTRWLGLVTCFQSNLAPLSRWIPHTQQDSAECRN